MVIFVRARDELQRVAFATDSRHGVLYVTFHYLYFYFVILFIQLTGLVLTLCIRLLRSRMMGMACYSGHEACKSNATRLFRAWIEDNT